MSHNCIFLWRKDQSITIVIDRKFPPIFVAMNTASSITPLSDHAVVKMVGLGACKILYMTWRPKAQNAGVNLSFTRLIKLKLQS